MDDSAPGPPRRNHGSGPRDPEPTAQRADDDRPADRPAGRGRRPRRRVPGPVGRGVPRPPPSRGTDPRTLGAAPTPVAAPRHPSPRRERAAPGAPRARLRAGRRPQGIGVQRRSHPRLWRRCSGHPGAGHQDTRGTSTPPRTDVRQHTPDPRHRHRVTPSHLRTAPTRVSSQPLTDIRMRTCDQHSANPGNGHYPWPAHRAPAL